MKTQIKFFICCSLVLCSFVGITQNKSISKWVIDQNNSISCQNIIYTENSDTVFFLNNVTLSLEFITLEGAEKVIYNKRIKKLLILPMVERVVLKMKDGKSIVSCTYQGSTNSGNEMKKGEYMEYTLGENLLFIR